MSQPAFHSGSDSARGRGQASVVFILTPDVEFVLLWLVAAEIVSDSAGFKFARQGPPSLLKVTRALVSMGFRHGPGVCKV